MQLTMTLDHAMEEKLVGYVMYRSEEMEGDRPVADGLYLQRGVLAAPPPETIRVTIELDP
jgi:hypothetical protein